jgi:hypothetical protein
MTRDEIISFAKFIMNVNDSQLSDDITDERWIELVQMAYVDVWARFKQTVSRASLLEYTDLTWPAGSNTLALPNSLKDAVIYDIVYVDSNGVPYSRFQGYFEKRNLLRLDLTGQSAAQSFILRFYFIPEVENLDNPTSTPVLIAPNHQKVIAWEAARVVKALSDKEVPESWNDKIDEIEQRMIIDWKSRPIAQRPNIISSESPFMRPFV